MDPTLSAPSSHSLEETRSITFPQANIAAIRSIADVVRSTVGPQSMDVLVLDTSPNGDGDDIGVQTGDYTVTGDGAHLLESLSINHSVGELLEGSIGPNRPGETDIDGKDIFDGSSLKILFASELLNNSINLLDQGLHPTTIVGGYRSAWTVAEETLDAQCVTLSRDPRVSPIDAARTALTGNDFGGIRNKIANLAATAADEIGRPNERSLDVTTIQHGSIRDSRLISGAVLDRNSVVHQRMPRRVEDASILLLGGHDRGGLQDPDIVDSFEIELDTPDTIGAFEQRRVDARKGLVEEIAGSGVDVVLTQMGINSHYQQLLANRGILAVRRVHPRNLQRLSLATGATIVKDVYDVDSGHLGSCDTVVETKIEQRKHRKKHRRIVIFEGCHNPNSVTMLLCGVFGQLASQAPREVRKAVLAAAESTRECGVVPGGGAIEMTIARRVRRKARKQDSKSQLAMNEYAAALEGLVKTLVNNAGMDPLNTVTNLRKENRMDPAVGVSLPVGEITDTLEAGIVDTTATKKRIYGGGTDLAELVLRVDDALDATSDGKPVDTGDVV